MTTDKSEWNKKILILCLAHIMWDKGRKILMSVIKKPVSRYIDNYFYISK